MSMFRRIKSLCNRIISESWYDSIVTDWKSRGEQLIDIYVNPTRSELVKMTRGGDNPQRFFIDTNGDVYLWDGNSAMHDDVAKKIKKAFRVKGAIWSDKYVEFFKVASIPRVYDEVEHSHLKDMLDKDYIDNLNRTKPPVNANESKKNEALGYDKDQIMISPTLSDIKRAFYQADRDLKASGINRRNGEKPSVRFLVPKSGEYYVANADDWIHGEMAEKMGIKIIDVLAGQLYSDGYVWFYKYSLFYYFNITDPSRVFMDDNELTQLFMKTRFYKMIEPMVTSIDYE